MAHPSQRTPISSAVLTLMLVLSACAEAPGPPDIEVDTLIASEDAHATRADDSRERRLDVHEDPLGGRGLAYGFFAIHLDPGPVSGLPDGTPNPSRPKAYLDALVWLVEAADTLGHTLTLMFTAQWAAHIASPLCELPPGEGLSPEGYAYQGEDYEDCLSLVRAFEAHGHEIALHHHPESAPASWDGFSNELEDAKKQGYLGSVDDLLAYVAAVPLGGAQAITAATTEEFPSGAHHIRVTSARGPTPYEGPEALGDLASRPCAFEEGGARVWRMRMRTLAPTHAVELSQAARELSQTSPAYTAGFVTHAKDVEGSHETYTALFSQLDSLGITLQALSEVVARYGYTQGAPDPEGARACPADEAL